MAAAPKPEVGILPSADLVAESAARRFVAAAEEAIKLRSRFVVALSGGSTPKAMYARLAALPLAGSVDWPRVEFLWGDERCVPPDREASNYRMVRASLLDHVPVDRDRVHRIRGEDPPVEAARAYGQELRQLLGTPAGPPAGGRIDLVLLGLGEDGHTASLFPGGEWMQDPVSWVRAEYSRTAGQWRVTLMPVVINAAVEIIFLVTGKAKAAVVRQVLEPTGQPGRYPAQVISPSAGRLKWLLDTEAAAALSRIGDRSPF